jgi:hypothetical protein
MLNLNYITTKHNSGRRIVKGWVRPLGVFCVFLLYLAITFNMEFGGSNPTLFVKTIWYVQFGLFCSIPLADFLGYKKLVSLLVFLFGGCIASLWYSNIITAFSFVGLLITIAMLLFIHYVMFKYALLVRNTSAKPIIAKNTNNSVTI